MLAAEAAAERGMEGDPRRPFANDGSAYVAYETGARIYVKHLRADGTLGSTPPEMDGGPDSGTDGGPDSGTDGGPDSGTDVGLDASIIEDAAVDALPGMAPDTGTVDAGTTTPPSSSGCGCSTTPSATSWPVGLLVAGAVAGRRRLRRRALERRS
jgi:MYXO-CTERM domain-containing protein